MKCFRLNQEHRFDAPGLSIAAFEHKVEQFIRCLLIRDSSLLHTTLARVKKKKKRHHVAAGNSKVLPVFNLWSIFKWCHPGRCDRAFAEPRCYFTCLSLSETHLYAPG